MSKLRGLLRLAEPRSAKKRTRNAMSESSQLSRRERQIMDIIYAQGEATATVVLANMSDAPTRTSVRTLLRILEEKGHLRAFQNRAGVCSSSDATAGPRREIGVPAGAGHIL